MEKDTSLFVAYEEHEGFDVAEAEKNLMRAILKSAMEDIRKKGEPHRDARRYLLSEEEHYLYSFKSVCYHLNLCPKTIRRVLGLSERRMRENAQVAA